MKKPVGYNEYDNFAFHPHNVLLVLVLASITVIFLTLTSSFLYSRALSGAPPIKLPLIFLLNTAILLGSSATMHWAKKSYLDDDTPNYQRALGVTIILSLVFLVLQFTGWRELIRDNVFFQTHTSASYLYLISILHFLHVIAGLPFLALFLQAARTRMVDPVSVLVYFSDPEKRLKLRLLTLYWHFLDALWIYLVVFFLVAG